MPQVKETTWDLLISGDKLNEVAIPRCKEHIESKVPNEKVDSYYAEGWNHLKTNKKNTTIYKEKPIGTAFEDEVWSIFYNMGFKIMNENNKFAIVYGEQTKVSKQIDIVAIDDETCLFIECKESWKYDTKRNLQMDINEVPSYFAKCSNVIKSKYPNLKFKYIFATKNINVSQVDKSRMLENNIVHFDYATILYYKALVCHLGSAAKYQLLGQLFAGQNIQNIEARIPAIRGKMGAYTYYSFVIPPEKLLKISYVLHKTNANNDYEDLLPSYQRLIKKDRLKSVRAFIDAGNFFPNSIIISIDSPKKPLRFDFAPKENIDDSLTKMGILYLPQKYQSAYIIDGQHRLYGYSDSEYSDNNSIPVIAFENLDKKTQLKLFMDINLNQKAVPKALRNILEIDVYYNSDNPSLAQGALLGKIAKRLGEDSASSLNNRVIIGEDAGTIRCCITIENIKLALQKTRLFNKLKNNKILRKGILDKNNNDATFDAFYPTFVKYINTIRNFFGEEWDRDDSFFVKNNIVGAYIRLFDDMISIEYEKNNSINTNPDKLWASIEKYIELLVIVLSDLSEEDRDFIIKQRGAAAPTNVYRMLEMKMFESDSSLFTNNDIENYYITYYKNYNDEAKPKIASIKESLLNYLKSIFTEPCWMREHLSEKHENDLMSRINSKNNSNSRNGINEIITEWDEINFNDIGDIINYGSNWTMYFKTQFNEWIPDVNKNTVLSIIKTISKCSENIRNGHKISGPDYNEIDKLYKAMIGK